MDDVDAVKAEAAAAEDAAGPGMDVGMVGKLRGVELRIKPPQDWRASVLDSLDRGVTLFGVAMGVPNFTVVARGVLEEDSVAKWNELDPTLNEAMEFFSAFEESTGQSLGKSGGASGSSTSTRRRSSTTSRRTTTGKTSGRSGKRGGAAA